MVKKLLIILVVAVALIGVGVWKVADALRKAGKLADEAVAVFHTQLNEGKDDDMYKGSSQGFRDTESIEKLRAVTAYVRSGLGKFLSTERTGISLNTNNGDKTINVSYKSKYEKKEVPESFVFDYNGDTPLLRGFEIDPKKESNTTTPAPANPPVEK